MEVIKTAIEGVYIIEPKVFGDNRGYFFESFSARDFAQATGLDVQFVQDNESLSRYGVLRGLHFQRPPYAQAKLVRVARGRVFDVAVDIRRGSPTFGQYVCAELSEENHRLVFLPKGMAHGFAVLSEEAVFQYKCDEYYHPEAEGGIAWDDPSIGIPWPLPSADIVLSQRDLAHPRLGEIGFKVARHGAELQSLQFAGHEYLWHGDPAFWGRRSPILFPMVGKVYGGVFRVDGKEYPMGQHGFARDSEFVFDGERYVLADCTLERYPYRFELSVRYRAEGRRFFAEWVVLNTDSRDIHFQIGAHPALMLPDYRLEDSVHGYLQCFDGEGKVVEQPMLSHGLDGGYLTELAAPVPMPMDEDGLLPITGETFAIDTFMLEHGAVKSVTLLDKSRRPYLSVGSDQTEAYGIWAPHKPGCPFVCLEPWCGITDLVGFSGELSERYLNHRLAPGEKFAFTYWIEIY